MGKRLHTLMWFVLLRMAKRQQRATLHLARLKAATVYVRGVQAARGALLGWIALSMLLMLLGGGFLLLHAGLYLYLPWDQEDRALLLLVLGGLYVLVPLIVVGMLSSDRLWMRASGADQAVERALRNRTLRPKDGGGS